MTTDEIDAGANRTEKTADHRIPNWLAASILIFLLSVIGLVISVFVGLAVPFWLLFGFALVYSIEKWFRFNPKTDKSIGKLYRLFLNLFSLSLLGLLIWSGARLFSKHFVPNPLVGSLIFLGEFACFIWTWKVVSKHSWRWPSMKLTTLCLLALFLVMAFAGVQPLSNFKDTVASELKLLLPK